MCGINGIYAFAPSAAPVDRAELTATRDQMASRGPDDAGLWVSPDGRTGLGHRRLSIIELSSLAAQPMATPDDRLHIVFNGEIYNYTELRAELESRGARFRGHSDTETLLQMYQYDGPAMVERLRGMFAFAIWDSRERELFLARDRFGMKPLYYAVARGQFRFASQTKALLAGGAVSRDIGAAGVAGFLLWGSVPEPFTIYEAIRSFPAGHTLLVTEGGKDRSRPYWQLCDSLLASRVNAEQVPPGEERICARAALRDSVRHHLVADVPVGAFLSAGLDSSTVVGLALENDSRCTAITLGFQEFRDEHYNEIPGARRIADHLQAKHRVRVATLEEAETDLPAFFQTMDQPTIDGLNTWFVSKAASEAGLKVALSGLGGDELLGGYHTFQSLPSHWRRCKRLRKLGVLGSTYRQLYTVVADRMLHADPRKAALLKSCGSVRESYRMERALFMPWELLDLIDRDLAREGMSQLAAEEEKENSDLERLSATPFGLVSYLETKRYMGNQLLRDTDWIGMSFSLEIRVPFVDHLLLEQVSGLAAAGRLGAGKSVLAGVLRDPLPDDIVNRRKSGFAVPIWRWLNSSPELDAWKGSRLLRRPNNRPTRRWAYTLLARHPGAKDALRT